MDTNVFQFETRLERLWNVYVQARETSAHSTDINDGIAAGRAYAAFVREFLRPDDREAIEQADRRTGS